MNFKKGVPYLTAIGIFIIVSLIYFYPVLQGEKISQSDITQFTGMAKEIQDFRADKGTEPYWTGSAFSGMPAFQLSAYYPNDYVRYLDKTIRFLPRPADYLFLYFLGFFLLLTALNTHWRLSILGALAFGFSTYLIIIFGAGHNAKAHAIGYMPMVIAGVIWIFKRKYLLGFIVTALATALEIHANHPQMTYYMAFIIIILGIVELIDTKAQGEKPNSFKETVSLIANVVLGIVDKTTHAFWKQVGLILFAMMLGLGVNSTRLLSMKQYADYSTRGKSELTINPDGTEKVASTGLDKSYITEYSYGKAETFNLLIPRYMGGGTVEELSKSSNTYKFIASKAGPKQADGFVKQVFTYWGEQPIIEAPAYIGAVIFFLFFLGIFLVKGKYKYWLVIATIFSLLMSWGKNFEFLTNFFIDYVPLYNKFRAVSSIQVIAELCVPILGVLALKELFYNKLTTDEKIKALKKSGYITVGIISVAFLYAYGFSTFEGIRDANYQQYPGLLDAVIADRQSILIWDTLRSIGLVTVTFGLLWMLLHKKLSEAKVITGLVILILFDLVSVDKRYVNEEDFKPAIKIDKPFVASAVDTQILKDKSHYRVANFATNPIKDGRTSYFHKSIGGYHAAKLGRYQELYDYQIARNNVDVFNMLNVKYFIFSDQSGKEQAQINPDANGNAWFIQELKIANSANEEIKGLDSLDTKSVAVISKLDYGKIASSIDTNIQKDSTASIRLVNYDVTTLEYEFVAAKTQFVVFSEIFYKDGWKAYINNELTPHYRVNYVLRGMPVSAGKHSIVFKFEPSVISRGNTITLFSYGLLILIPIGWFFIKRKKK
ncbi:MAG: YfhO family protein [Flavobacteriaceae bacterium]